MFGQGIIYFIIGISATMFGALAGIGGGVIIKPVLDALGHYDVSTISALSSFTVLSMAIASSFKQIKAGVKIEGLRTIILVLGSIVGGIAGKVIFKSFLKKVGNEALITGVQSIILIFILILVLYIYQNINKIPRLNITNLFVTFIVGMILGIKSSFLGIGGGPINIAVLAILFNLDAKSVAVHSVFIILFSQSSKLLLIGLDNMFQPYDLKMLLFMIPGGIAGGILGSNFNRKLPVEKIRLIFKIAFVFIIILNIYNLVKSFS